MRLDQPRDRVRKTFQYQVIPTPAQEQALATVVWRCRELYTAGLQERSAKPPGSRAASG